MRPLLQLSAPFAFATLLFTGAFFLLSGATVHAQPAEVPVRDAQREYCHDNNDVIVVTLPEEEGWTFTDTGWINGKRTITKIFPGDPNYEFVFDYEDGNTPCIVSPHAPVQTEVCGSNNDIIDASHQPEGIVIASDTGWSSDIRTITFATTEGYILASGETEVWYGFNDSGMPCDVDPPPVPQTIVCGPDNDDLAWDAGGLTVDDSGWIDGQRQIGFLVQPETSQWLYQAFWDDDTSCLELTEANQIVVCGPNNDEIIVDRTGFTTMDAGWMDGKRLISFTEAATGKPAGSLEFKDLNTPCDTPEPDPEVCDPALTVTLIRTFGLSTGSTGYSAMRMQVDPCIVTPKLPNQSAICGPNNDELAIPNQPEGISVSTDTGWLNNNRAITFAADPGYTIDGDTTLHYTDSNTPCPESPVKVTGLPSTGVGSETPGTVLWMLAAMVGLGTLTAAFNRSRILS